MNSQFAYVAPCLLTSFPRDLLCMVHYPVRIPVPRLHPFFDDVLYSHESPGRFCEPWIRFWHIVSVSTPCVSLRIGVSYLVSILGWAERGSPSLYLYSVPSLVQLIQSFAKPMIV